MNAQDNRYRRGAFRNIPMLCKTPRMERATTKPSLVTVNVPNNIFTRSTSSPNFWSTHYGSMKTLDLKSESSHTTLVLFDHRSAICLSRIVRFREEHTFIASGFFVFAHATWPWFVFWGAGTLDFHRCCRN